jgi:hypothetical protein
MTRTSGKPLLLLCAAILITAVVYWPGLSGGFVFDDYPNIVHNDEVHVSSLSWKQLRDAALSAPPAAFNRPLAALSFGLNWFATGADPGPMKLTNLLIHLANGLLLYAMLCALLDAKAAQERTFSHPADRWLALAVSACWLLLPINLTAVLYVVQRMESLCQFFVLSGLWLYFSGRRIMLTSANAQRANHGLGLAIGGLVLGTCIGMLAKESAVLLPLYAFLAEFAVLRFDGYRRPDRRLWLVFVLCLFLPAIIGAAWLLPKISGPDAWSFRTFSLAERLLTESRVLIEYLRWTLLPNPRVLGLSHDDIAISHGLFAPISTTIALCGLAGLLTLAVTALPRMPLVALGVFWFFAAHLLTASVIPLELVFEHRNYFASIGVLLAVCAALERAASTAKMPAIKWVIILALGLQFVVVTHVRAREWSDSMRLAVSEAQHHPQSVRANYAAAQSLIAASQYQPSPALDAGIAFAKVAASLPGNSILPEQAMIVVANRAYHREATEDWDNLVGKLTQQPPSREDIGALIALNNCFIRQQCLTGQRMLQRAYEAAVAHRSRTQQPLRDAYVVFLRDVLHDEEAAMLEAKDR